MRVVCLFAFDVVGTPKTVNAVSTECESQEKRECKAESIAAPSSCSGFGFGSWKFQHIHRIESGRMRLVIIVVMEEVVM